MRNYQIVRTHTHARVYCVCRWKSVYVCVCICVYMRVCMCARARVWFSFCIYECVCVCILVCVYRKLGLFYLLRMSTYTDLVSMHVTDILNIWLKCNMRMRWWSDYYDPKISTYKYIHICTLIYVYRLFWHIRTHIHILIHTLIHLNAHIRIDLIHNL